MTSTWLDAVALARKDIRTEIRTRSALASAVAVGAIGILLAALALGPSPDRLRMLAPALTWLAFLYASTAVADRLDGLDRADDAFSALWLALEDRRAIYLGRVVALTVLLSGLLVALWALSLIVLDVQVGLQVVGLLPILVVGAAAVSAEAALVFAVVGAVTGRALLLPILLLPMLVPTLIASIRSTESLLASDMATAAGWATVLVAQLALFLGVGLIAFETAAAPE